MTDRPVLNAVIGTMLLILFSYFIHDLFPLRAIAFVALMIVALLIGLDRGQDKLLGTMKDRSSLVFGILLATAGALILVYYLRAQANMPIIPKTFGPFTIVALAIGCTEELVFRGWVQSRFKGPLAGIVFAAFAHAAYKSALFLSPHIMYDIDAMGLFQMTFLAGLFLGATRYYTGTVWPALIAHGIFDLLVYADSPQPWWVF